MKERMEAVSLEVDGQKLRGMIHFPSGEGPFPAVALFHGFTGQRMEPHFIFVKLARLLAKNKIIAVRFDFRGSGESEGEFQDMTIPREVEDGIRIVDFLKKHLLVDKDRLGIVGLSLGGCIARLVATKQGNIKCLVFWSAVASPEELIKQKLTEEYQVTKEGYIDFGGNKVGKDFLATLPQVEGPESLSAYRGKALIIHGTKDDTVPLEHAYQLKKILPFSQLKKIEGADHTYNRVDWEEEVLRKTVSFLKDNL